MAELQQPVTDQDHIRGNPDAPITLVEYGDFECPHCGAAHPVVRDLMEHMGENMRFVYRHFPLQESHPHAALAAEAAEAAGAQGKFWQMHDKLFRNQQALEVENLYDYAAQIGLDADQLLQDLKDRRHEPEVNKDFLSGVRSGVNGTPTFYINGLRYDGPVTQAALLNALETI
jgi:protein-disulfide isomerase